MRRRYSCTRWEAGAARVCGLSIFSINSDRILETAASASSMEVAIKGLAHVVFISFEAALWRREVRQPWRVSLADQLLKA
jgi:hypothetical protein